MGADRRRLLGESNERSSVPRFRISANSRSFLKQHFPGATHRDWNDWRWQIRHRIRDRASLERVLRLSDDERRAVQGHTGPLPVGITPYYASLLDPTDPTHGLRRTVVMVPDESVRSRGEAIDPLGEDSDSPVPGLVHRYPDRVVFLVTGFCPVYCRYCTRSRLVGRSGDGYRYGTTEWQRAIDYIAATPAIRDVLLSGGDPLSLSDEKLNWLLTRLRRIPHVEIIRIGSKMPVATPQRITPALVRMLKRHHPLWMSIHITHPQELTLEVADACERLADGGIPLGSQSVLMKGINDDVPTLMTLFRGLLRIRVRPYYLFQCDPVFGTAHFRVPVARALEMMRGLQGWTTGYAIPTFAIDGPGGGGKMPLLPDYLVGRDGDDVLLRNFEGKLYRYPDPPAGARAGDGA